eukprot:jgi/Ulvmu1/2578/UM014_0029.1
MCSLHGRSTCSVDAFAATPRPGHQLSTGGRELATVATGSACAVARAATGRLRRQAPPRIIHGPCNRDAPLAVGGHELRVHVYTQREPCSAELLDSHAGQPQ